MSDVVSLLKHHGYAALALLVFCEAIGLPVPAAGSPADGAEHPAPRRASAAAALLDEAFGPEPG